MSTPLWEHVFGNVRPVEVEIGPGRGDVLLAFAASRREVNFFGIERIAPAAEDIVAAAAQRGLPNVRAVGGDARCIVATVIPPSSVRAYHVYFPDPWPKTRHRHRRLFQDGDFARHMARTLEPDGLVHLASDLAPLLAQMRAALVRAGFLILEAPGTAPVRPTTKYERRYGAAGTHAATLRRAAAS